MFKKNNEKEKKENFSLGLKRFILELKKRKMESFILFIFIFFSYAISTFAPLLMGKILDSLIEGGEKTFLWFTVSAAVFYLIWLGITVFVGKFSDVFLLSYFTVKMANSVYIKYTKKIFSTLISYPTSFFKENSLGKTTYSLNTGATKLSSSFQNITDMIGFPMLIIFNMFFLFFITWQGGLLILAGNIIFVIYFLLTIEKRKKTTKEFNTAKKSITNFLTENINFSIEVKKNSSEKKENGNLVKNFKGDYDQKFRNKLYFNLKNTTVSELLWYIFFILFYILIIYLFKNDQITAGALLSAVLYSGAVNRNIHWFMRSLNGYVEDFTIIGDTEKLLLHKSENYSAGKIRGEVSGEIEFENVSFVYEQEQKNPKDFSADSKNKKKNFSLEKINIKIKKGQKVAFVGESGGGKSTSVELVGGFYLPNSGKVLIDNISTEDWNLNDLRSSIAYVSQDIAIFNTTIGENISYGVTKEVSQEEIKKAAKLANISEFIENLPNEYKTSVGEKGLKLSGGQKQRIAIARAILRDPKILILDEPTSALDIKSEKHIIESLKTLMKNRTTIIVAHRLSTVKDADKIFVFKEGKVVEEGSYQELISKNGEFKKMVDLHEQLN